LRANCGEVVWNRQTPGAIGHVQSSDVPNVSLSFGILILAQLLRFREMRPSHSGAHARISQLVAKLSGDLMQPRARENVDYSGAIALLPIWLDTSHLLAQRRASLPLFLNALRLVSIPVL
jgi:hypothetical protein